MKKLFLIIIIMIIVGAVFWFFESQTPEDPEELADEDLACINSGGIVSTGLCCESAGDFPDTCAIGACGCAPEYSHEVKTCDCEKDRCFNGIKCVTFEEAEKLLKEPEKIEGLEEKKKQPEILSSYRIENPPYYREKGFCWGASAMMLMMYDGFTDEEVQEFRTTLKSGLGGTARHV